MFDLPQPLAPGQACNGAYFSLRAVRSATATRRNNCSSLVQVCSLTEPTTPKETVAAANNAALAQCAMSVAAPTETRLRMRS